MVSRDGSVVRALKPLALRSLVLGQAMYTLGKHSFQVSNYLTHLMDPGETTTYGKLLLHLKSLGATVWDVYTTESVSRMLRLLPIVTKGPKKRVETFQAVSEQLDWGARTQNTYWGALLSLLKLCSLQLTIEDAAFTKLLDREAMQAERWDVEDESQVLDNVKIDKLRLLARSASPNSAWRAAWITLALGQRMGDVLLLTAPNVTRIGDSIAVTVTEGKTIPTRGPYTMRAPAAGDAGSYLWEAATLCQQNKQDGPRLFKIRGMDDAAGIRSMERQVKETLRIDIRALRRTGLIRLSLAADTTLETLLSFSRHSTINMLETYLCKGLFNQAQGAAQHVAVHNSEEAKMPTTSCAWH